MEKDSKKIKFKLFYNPDCNKYNVLKYGNLMNDCMGDRWQQVTLPDKPAYTKYRKVAERWMNKIITLS